MHLMWNWCQNIDKITVLFKNPIWPPKPEVVYEYLKNSRYGQFWFVKEESKAFVYTRDIFLREIQCPFIDINQLITECIFNALAFLFYLLTEHSLLYINSFIFSCLSRSIVFFSCLLYEDVQDKVPIEHDYLADGRNC